MLSHIYQNRSFLKNDEDQMLANCRETESLLHCRQECKKVLSLWKTVWQLLKLKKKKLNIQPTYDLEVVHLGVYPR